MSFGDARKLAITAAIVLVAGFITPISANAIDDPCLSSTAIIGTPGDDIITGTPGDDIICTLAGDDTIEGLAGDDIIIAGDGDDRIISMEGNDYIEAGDGDDFVDAGPGDDELLGNPGDDILWGGLGIDELLGLAGDDNLDGGAGADSLDGGLDRDYCVRDSKDKEALSCFYDTKAPVLKSISVSANSRSIDTSVTAQWVRVKALVTEAGSGLTEAGFMFVNWKSKSMTSFGYIGSLKYPDRLPTSCTSLDELAQTPPPKTIDPKGHWCIDQKSSSAVVLEFLIAAPFRLAKGTYEFSGITLHDGALNQSSQNGARFKVSVKQTASVPTGIPVLRSFEFISDNKVNTTESSAKIVAEAAISTGPVGLGRTQIKFVRDVDRNSGANGLDLIYDPERSASECDLTIAKGDQKSTCVLSEEAGVVRLILVSSLPKNSPAGSYRFSMLGVGSKTSYVREYILEDLKNDSRYEKFTKLAIVQSGPSVPFKATGNIEIIGITSNVKQIDTGTGPATFDVQISIRRTGNTDNWIFYGNLYAMHCPSGSIRKFNQLISKSQNRSSYLAGEYCAKIIEMQGKKTWIPDSDGANPISTSGYVTIQPGSSTASTTLTIPANFRKGLIIVGLNGAFANIGKETYASINGNWYGYPIFTHRNPFPGTLSCGKYRTCTQHYAVLQNGQK
jgi:hypothetical protein